MPRWVNIIAPFNYEWPGRAAVTHYSATGDFMVKDEVADYAVRRGFALEGKADQGSRSRKGKTAPRKRVTRSRASNARAVPPVGDARAADADRPADRPAVDSDAG